jgi:TonB-dependent receptor
MLQRLLVIGCFLFTAWTSQAQNGSIGGQVLDVKTNEAIIGANVVIQGTTVGGSTDIDGNFTISNVKPGTYTLSVTYIAYKSQTIADVVVEPGKRTSLQITLVEDIAELEEVVVTAKRDITTDLTLLNAIKESKLVVSGISSEQIVRLPDRDAAQIAQRVPGITIVDNRFILIRGVPERYNQVMINGANGPSTEIDKRSFSFDLIPAGTIDQMLIYKSGSAELPGDFAGGVIQLITKNPSYEPFTNVGLTFGYRTNTTFKDFVSSEGSSTDFLGFDNGFRDLPSNFPSVKKLDNSATNSNTRLNAGRSLTNNFANQTRTAPVDMGLTLSTGNNFNWGHAKFSNLTSIAYSNSYQYYNADFLRYNSFDATSATKRFQYKDNFYSNDVRFNAMHNWTVELNDRNKFEFKNLFVQLGENETTIRTGEDYFQNPNFDRTNYAYHYMSRSIYSGQLEGKHTLGDGSAHLSWVLATNRINRNEPDYRRFRTYRDKSFAGTEEPYSMQLPAAGNIFETGRFWSKLEDVSYSNGLNFEKKFGDANDKRVATLKAGYYGEYRTRNFNARVLNYLFPGSDPVVADLIRLPLDQIFAPGNIKRTNGFVIEDATEKRDTYEGSNLLTAGYVSGMMPLGKFDVTAGFRGEYNEQKLTTYNNLGKVEVNNPIFAPLPFLNTAYNVSDRSLVRVAYSRTVNRPEFRELAPFLYYQFDVEASVYGNPNLKTAFIHNVDLRYEIYPNPGEMLSVGGFYKQFSNPIESFLQVTSDNPQFEFRNAQSATNFGVELEMRKSLASLGISKFFRNTSVNLNAAWIKSQVDIGTGNNTGNLQRYRPLQGQSPYIINMGLYYMDDKSGLSTNLAYNVFGPRIFSVGDVNFPSWWEMPRQSVDFQIAKKWGTRFETKLNIQNLLNAAYRIYQDNDQNKKIESEEALIQRYKVGSQFSLGLNWKIAKQ